MTRRISSEFLTGTEYRRVILIERMKYRPPVQRVREDQLHFFFGAPWRYSSRFAK